MEPIDIPEGLPDEIRLDYMKANLGLKAMQAELDMKYADLKRRIELTNGSSAIPMYC